MGRSVALASRLVNAFVLECEFPVEAIGDLAAELARARAAAAVLTAAGRPTHIVHSLYVPAERRCLSVVEAPDIDTVHELIRRSRMGVVNVHPAISFTAG